MVQDKSLINLLLADSNELIRCGLKEIFQQREEINIIGEASNEDELSEFLMKDQVDVVVIDHTSTGFSIDTIPKVHESHPEVKFMAITFDRSGLAIKTALKSGVMSYVKKDCGSEEIIDSVLETAKGKMFFCGKILEAIAESSIDVDKIDREELNCEAIALSQRELEIIRLIAEGYTTGQIAEQLFLSEHTVTTHRKNIMKKLGVKNTAGIVMYAVKTELVSPNRFVFASME